MPATARLALVVTFELTAKSTWGSHQGRQPATMEPGSSVFRLDAERRQALLGALDAFESDYRDTLRVGPPRRRPGRLPPPPPGPPSGYQLVRLVGQGGVGEIWRARQHSLQREIAVKKLRLFAPKRSKTLRQSEQERLSRAAFVQEALIAGSLAHPNVIPVYDLGVGEDGGPLLAMKLVEGEVWASVLDKDAGRPERFRRHLEVLQQVCNAVAFAHSRHIIHRDLKPAQVMLGEYGEVLLMDWGLAIDDRQPTDLAEGERTIAPLRRNACSPAGTPVYMAPEQTYDHAEHVTHRTDVYLLGGILYEILTGYPPHAAETVDRALELARPGEIVRAPESGRRFRPPDELMVVAMRALAPDPENRYASVLEFSEAIESFLAGASRREESRNLTIEARDEYESMSAGDYMELARIDAELTRALVLWPDNRDASRLRQDVLREYAAAAVSAGDLKLADLLGLHFDNEEDLHDLREQISLTVRQKVRGERGRRARMIATTIVILALLAGGWALASMALDAQREAAERERLALKAAGKIVESLARGMDRPFPGSTSSRVEMLNDALSIYGELGENLPESAELNAGMSEAYMAVFDAYRSLGLKPLASGQMLDARAAAERAARLEPDSPAYLRRYADTLLRAAQWRLENHETAKAREFLTDARLVMSRIATASAGDSSLRAVTMELERVASLIEGRVYSEEGKIDRALEQFNRSVEIAQRLAARGGDGDRQAGLMQSLSQLAMTYDDINDPENTGFALRELVKEAERRFDRDRDDPRARRDLVEAFFALQDYLARFGRPDEAEVYLDDAVLRAREFVDANPRELDARGFYAETLLRASAARLARGRIGEARTEAGDALEAYELLLAEAPSDDAARRGKARSMMMLARIDTDRKESAAAADAISDAQSLLEQLLLERPEDAPLIALLGEALVTRAVVAAHRGVWNEAHACYVRWNELESRYLNASPNAARAELELIAIAARFASVYDSAPPALRLERQRPIVARVRDVIQGVEGRLGAEKRAYEVLDPAREQLERQAAELEKLSAAEEAPAPAR
jgi:serine/threonine protein kinase